MEATHWLQEQAKHWPGLTVTTLTVAGCTCVQLTGATLLFSLVGCMKEV